MTPQELNIAIAEERGYTNIHYDWINGSDAIKDWMHDKGRGIPDYCHDLNAMHEVEVSILISDSLTSKWLIYMQANTNVCGVHATALQRAEAYARVKGIWRD